MKLHLQGKVSLSNTSPKIDPIRFESLFIYYASGSVIICDISSSKILQKFKYADVQMLKIHKNNLLICTNELYMLDLVNFELVDVFKMSKSLISKINFCNDNFIISKIDNRISFFKDKKKIYEISNDKSTEDVFIGEFYNGFFDAEKAVIFSNLGNKIKEFENDEIVTMHSVDNSVYALLSSGILIDLISQEQKELNIDVQAGYFTEKDIFAFSGNNLLKLNYNGEISDSNDILEMIGRYSGVPSDYYQSVIEDLTGQVTSLVKKRKLNIINEKDLDQLSEDQSNATNNNSDDLSTNNNSDELFSNNNNSDDLSTNNNNDGLSNSNNNSDELSNDSINDQFDNSSQVTNNEENYNEENGLESIQQVNNTEDSENQEELEEDNSSIEFSFIDSNLIKTSDNDFIFISNNEIIRIFTFPDNLTDSFQFSDYLFLSTSSGHLKYINLPIYTKGEFISNSRLIKLHKTAIINAKIFKNVVITSSHSGTIAFHRIEEYEGALTFTKVYQMSCSKSLITALAYQNDILAVATRDCVLQIFKAQDQFPENSSKIEDYNMALASFFNSFENVSTQKLHTKHINHLSLTPKFIITSSNDKTAKILDFNGSNIKTISTDRTHCSSFDSKYIAICSSKGAKIFHSSSLSVITSFQSKRPILSSCFYNGYFLALSDILRIFDVDKKKCIKSYDFGLLNCWYFNFPFACAENKTVILEDTSVELQAKLLTSIRESKENSLLFSKFISDKDFSSALDVALRKTDETQVFKVICAGYAHDRNLGFLSSFIKNGEISLKIFDFMLKNGGFKGSEVFNKITAFFHESKVDKQRKSKLIQIVSKHCEAIDDLFIELSSLDIFKKQI